MEVPFYFYLPLFLALYMITRQFLAKFRNLPPSPFLNFPILGHLHLTKKKKKPGHRTFAEISSRYGPVVLLDFGLRRVLLVSSPSAAEECLNKHDIIFANRPDILAGKYLGYNYTSLMFAPYGDHWRNLRKIASLEILSSHRIQMLQGIRVDEVKWMMRRLFVASKSKKQSIEMKTLFFELVLNVMMRMIAGKRYSGGNDDSEVIRFKEIVEETVYFSVSTPVDYFPFLRWLGLDVYDNKFRVLQEKRDRLVQDLIEEFKTMKSNCDSDYGVKTEEKKNKTLIEVLLGLQEEDPKCNNDEMIKSLILVLLATGTDTSMLTMEWALSQLLNNPPILKTAQEEIDNVVGRERLLDESDLINLPYLRCIVNETLRMYPAAPLLPHHSSRECIVGSYRVPANTMTLINLWGIQNDPKIWDEPEKFEPERFAGVEGTKDGYKWMPFGSGRRSCAGENLAMRMIGLGLGSIIQCFDWEKIGNEMIDMTQAPGLTISKVQPLVAFCQPRLQMVHLLSQL